MQGASGGVGSYTVQIAKHLGAKMIIGAASTPVKREQARVLGANQVHKLTDGQGVDIVLEMSGGQVFAQSLQCLAPFGRAVVYGMASREPST